MKKLYKFNDFNLESFLISIGHTPAYVNKHSIDYHILITKLLFKRINNKGKKWHKLSTQELLNKFGRVTIEGKKLWKLYVIREDLKKAGMILFHTTQTSLTTRKAEYKFTDEFLEKGWLASDQILNKKIIAKMEKIQKYTGVYAKMQRVIMSVTVDFDNAKKYLDESFSKKLSLRSKKVKGRYINREMTLKTYSYWLQALEAIRDGHLFFSVDEKKTCRVFHNITNLPKELRKYVRINGKRLIELDVRNCQPLLFVIHLTKWANDNKVEDISDILKYKNLCETGTFYNHIKELIEKEGLAIKVNESEFKLEFFGRIFFSEEKKKYKWREVFAKHFPNVSKCITDTKVGDFKKLSIGLQKQESDIIILDICNRLYNEGCYDSFSIHDAIYCTAYSFDVVYNTMLESFQSYGLNATIKFKQL